MPRHRQPSKVEKLPKKVLKILQEMLDNPRMTQLEATERVNTVLKELRATGDPEALAADCPERVSNSAVNRYDLKMREVGERLQQSRAVAERWIGKLGAAPQSQVGNLVNEIIRTLSFDAALFMQEGTLDEENAPAVVAMLKDLALTTMRLEKAANLNVEREKEIRKQALEEAAEKVDKTARKAGLTPETIELIHEALGI